MGRKLRRVPLDFDWPLHEPWEGFICRLGEEMGITACPDCAGSGGSVTARYLKAIWYGKWHEARHLAEVFGQQGLPGDRRIPAAAVRLGLEVAQHGQRHPNASWLPPAWQHNLEQEDVDALVAADRLWDFTHRQVRPEQATFENGWTREPNGEHPTAAAVNRWSFSGLGHDSINRNVVVTTRCAQWAVSSACDRCAGYGDTATTQQRSRLEAWERTPPPEGRGYQVWETVSEGAPISPVFASPEAVIAWLVGEGYTPDAAARFVIETGWAPSLVAVDRHVARDIQSLADDADPAHR